MGGEKKLVCLDEGALAELNGLAGHVNKVIWPRWMHGLQVALNCLINDGSIRRIILGKLQTNLADQRIGR